MLLPSMAATLHLSYSQMGFISTANFLGYLASVLVSAHFAGRIGSRRLVFLALLTVAVSMALVSRATGFLSALLLYMITGIGSGATNVPVMGWSPPGFRAAGGTGRRLHRDRKRVRHHAFRPPDPLPQPVDRPPGWRTSWLLLAGS